MSILVFSENEKFFFIWRDSMFSLYISVADIMEKES